MTPKLATGWEIWPANAHEYEARVTSWPAYRLSTRPRESRYGSDSSWHFSFKRDLGNQCDDESKYLSDSVSTEQSSAQFMLKMWQWHIADVSL